MGGGGSKKKTISPTTTSLKRRSNSKEAHARVVPCVDNLQVEDVEFHEEGTQTSARVQYERQEPSLLLLPGSNLNLSKSEIEIQPPDGQTRSPSPAEVLPVDVLTLIFTWLDPPSLCAASRVCSVWKQVSDKSVIWKGLVLRNWGYLVKDNRIGQGVETARHWKSLFISRYAMNETPYPYVGEDEGGAGNHRAAGGIIQGIMSKGFPPVQVYSSSLWRGKVTDFLVQTNKHVWTENKPYSWFAVDFGPTRAVVPTHYQMCYGSSGNFCCPRNWILQATNSFEALKPSDKYPDPTQDPEWVILSVHYNDTTLDADFACHIWELSQGITTAPHLLAQQGTNGQTDIFSNNQLASGHPVGNIDRDKSYRLFRILQFGKNKYRVATGAVDTWGDVLVAGGFELYGYLRTTKTIENTYDVESNGIIHALGGYPNVQVYASSIAQGQVQYFISKANVHLWTKNKPYSWFAVDFGRGRTVSPTHYTLGYASGGNYCCPRNWLLQGTNNVHVLQKTKSRVDPQVDPNWTTLSTHINDCTLDAEFARYTWAIPPLEKNLAFRIFRIVHIGPNKFSGSAPWKHVLVAHCFELHGQLNLVPLRKDN